MGVCKVFQILIAKSPWRREHQFLRNSITLTMVDGARIVVPNSLDLITPYVLLEQQDWFEDEIKFLRRVMRPGQKIIDIGANYGVYTLALAKAVGPTGAVWAFEPASHTAAFLTRGIAANSFTQVTLVNSALSMECGTAKLTMHEHSEVNSLVHSGHSSTLVEAVSVITLDDCLRRYDWSEIDFMKIDAEGEETKILKGGRMFLSQLSPLIQYEVKAGENLHFGLVADFAAQGYTSYRLIPGLDLLISFDPDAPTDGYLLNLFCCKRQCAEKLAAEGLLVDAAFSDIFAAEKKIEALYQSTSREYNWQQNIAQLPYGVQLSGRWENATDTNDGLIIDDALTCYAISRDPKLPPTERFIGLQTAFTMLAALCQRQPNLSRLSSLARVARDFGARSVAVSALNQLYKTITQMQQVVLDEPFLAPLEQFDSIPPEEEVGNWFLASVLEAIEKLGALSSFYSGNAARVRLEMIATLGYGSEEMARRLRLLSARFGKSAPSGGIQINLPEKDIS